MRVIIVGSRKLHKCRYLRYLVVIGGKPLELPFRLFKMFAIMAIRRAAKTDHGWVEAKDLYCPKYLVYRYLPALRAKLPSGVVETSQDYSGFRLALPPASVTVCASMARFDDPDIEKEIERAKLRMPPATDIGLRDKGKRHNLESRSVI